MSDAVGSRVPGLARTRCGLSLALLSVIAGTFAVVDLAARNRWLAARIADWDLRRFEAGRERLMDRGSFLEFEDRLILEELPNTDATRGGVFFFGTSSLKWGLKLWELPAELRPLVHNYGIGATSHALQSQFIRYLVEHRGLLAPGGDRVHVVLAFYWAMALDWSPATFFGPLWERHGLYRYSERDGIQPIRLDPWQRRLREERARCSGFLGGNLNRLARLITVSLGIPLSETERLEDPAAVARWARRAIGGPSWRESLPRQMAELDRLITYLERSDVDVTFVLLPHRAPFEELELPRAYREEARRVCQRHAVPFIDLSRLLAEDEFWDINHSNYRGLTRTHDALLEIAVDRLRRSHAIR